MTMSKEWDELREQAKEYDECRYKVFVNQESSWMSISSAGITMNDGLRSVWVTDEVKEASGIIRPITDKEKKLINDLSEEWDANK